MSATKMDELLYRLFCENVLPSEHPDASRFDSETLKRMDAKVQERRARRKKTEASLPKFANTTKPSFRKEDFDLDEEKMTSADMKREEKLKKKYDDSEMKANFIKQYGPEKGKSVYFAYIRKQAMKEEVELDEAKLPRAEKRRIRQERQKGKSKGAVHAFDVDETLFSHGVKGKPNVKVHVNDPSGKRTQSLSNQEFNTHKLPKGHSYDFSEFRSAKKFSQTTSPNKSVIRKLKKLQRRGKNVHLITARDKFDNPEGFRQHFTRHGINIKPGNIHYTGGMRGGDVGQKKVAVAKGLTKMGKSKTINMYDDAAKVHKSFEAEKKKSPNLRIKTHLAKPNKKGEVMTRSYQATKEDFELWIENLLTEGYDLSNYSADELYEVYEELLDEAQTAVAAPGEYPHRPSKKPKTKLNYKSPYNKHTKKVEEEVELPPYEYWKLFIGEDVNETDDVEDDEAELQEELELSRYDLWKLHLDSVRNTEGK